MGKALYRKYRSKNLGEIIGQEHITETLARSLKNGTISHAYLLTGPRGVGKTSIARILAYEVNGLPYDEEGTHLDIIEIDAASNRRIDEIRELKDRVNIAPTSSKYKVYIIDEVHMLTKEAFNALLKTLEEPPEHAIFILATTEAHKVPETIQSRTQRFTFKPVTSEKVIRHLENIAKDEKIKIDNNALELIASHGEGSFRDSINLLDQLRNISESITLANVQQAIGQAPDELLEELLKRVSNKDLQSVADVLGKLREHGIQPAQLASQLSQVLRRDILDNSSRLSDKQALILLSALLNVPTSSDPGISIELALYATALDSEASSVRDEPVSPELNISKPAKSKANTTQPDTIKEAVASPPHATKAVITTGLIDENSWQDVLGVIKSKHNTLYGITRMAEPSFNEDKLILNFSFPFHKKKLDDSKNKKILLDIIKEVTGVGVTLECTINDVITILPPDTDKKTKSLTPVNLETISNIFGGAEIVE